MDCKTIKKCERGVIELDVDEYGRLKGIKGYCTAGELKAR